MNNLDPSDIRDQAPPKSPIGVVVNPTDYFSDKSATGLRQTARIQDSISEADEMSATSQPSGSDSHQTKWQPATRRVTNPQNGVGDKLSSILGGSDDGGLPMYKDKPYNYATSQKKMPFWRRYRLLLILLALFVILLMSSSVHEKIPTPVPSSTSEGKVRNTWSILSGHKKAPANWPERQERVKEAFKTSWAAYEKSAWGFDEFHPVSETSRQMVEPNGMGWIIVDALDTMMLMNLTTQLAHAREWITTTLSYDIDHDVNTFETTIRMVGGLLSAHYLSTTFPDICPVPPIATLKESQSEDLYLEKAADLADRLLGAYESDSGIPYASVNLHTRKGLPSHQDGGASSTSEATTLQLEMKYLAKLTGETNYWEMVEKIMKLVDDNGARDGLLPIFIYANEGTFRGENIRLGSRGDSYYEYLIKQYFQTSKQEPIYLEMWDQALEGIKKHLITYTKYSNLTVLAERPSGLNQPVFGKMDHLVCFMPGTIAFAATDGLPLEDARQKSGWSEKQEQEIKIAKELMKTCWGMYQVTTTGLSPEIAHFRLHDPPIFLEQGVAESVGELRQDSQTKWRMDYDIHPADFHNVQRPEFVESLFYMWRITGDVTYREWGWQIFEAFTKYTSLPDGRGFSSIADVDRIPPPTRDNMESYWLAETLKYLYLLFGPDDVLPLDKTVINTEGHPFPRFELGKLFKTGWERKPRDKDGNLLTQSGSSQTNPTPYATSS